MENSTLETLIAQRFIQRRDVKAVQIDFPTKTLKVGDWIPDRSFRDQSRHGLGFKMSHLRSHLAGDATYGHYLIDSDNRCRVFCLDIDLEKKGSYVEIPPRSSIDPWKSDEEYEDSWSVHTVSFEEDDPDPHPDCRDMWLDRSETVARGWWKMQMKMLASKFAMIITKELEIPCAAAYSGSKGVHVYGFLGDSTAQSAHEAAILAIDLVDEFEPLRGKVFFKHKNQDPISGYPSFSVEIFPKQATLKKKDLGNLLRLPLGRNLKSTDPTFFLDLTTPMGVFNPHPDPVRLLETGEPFA